MGRMMDLLFLICAHLSCRILSIVAVKRKLVGKDIQTIALLPYTAPNQPGGKERIANWKSYLEGAGFRVDVFWPVSHISEKGRRSLVERYIIFFKILWRRSLDFPRIVKYDGIWLQRAYIPQYPFKHALFESALRRKSCHFVADFYDADYEANPELTAETAGSANSVSVSGKYLMGRFREYNSRTQVLPMTIDPTLYPVKLTYDFDEIIRLGWMGSPGNAQYFRSLESVLIRVMERFDNVRLSVVCNDFPDLSVPNMEIHRYDDHHFDYFQWLATVDVGLVPYIGDTDRLRGKSSMKMLEFMAMGLPVITSPHGALDNMEKGKHFLEADGESLWLEMISRTIMDMGLRENLGRQGQTFFRQHHTYEVNLAILVDILTDG